MFSIPEKLFAQVQKDFGNQIQTKRIKKQLDLLNQQQIQQNTQINSINLTSTGLSIKFTYTPSPSPSKQYKFQLRIDKDYPFNPPQIHSLDNISYYGEGRDLLVEYLQEIEQLWSPAKMLRQLIMMVPGIVKIIQKVKGKGKEIGKYHNGEKYSKEEMQQKGMQVFTVQEQKGGFIGSKKQKKYMILSHNFILLSTKQQQSTNDFILQTHFKVQDINHIIADAQNSKFKLFTKTAQKEVTWTFETSKNQFSKILTLISPTLMLEKQIHEMEAGKYDVEKLLGLYGVLLEHYTTTSNQKKFQQCTAKMTALMNKHYKNNDTGLKEKDNQKEKKGKEEK